MGASNWVHLDVIVISRETEKAFLVVLDSGEEVWLPKSQIADAEDYQPGDADLTLSVTEYIAREKGLL